MNEENRRHVGANLRMVFLRLANAKIALDQDNADALRCFVAQVGEACEEILRRMKNE